MSDRAKNTQASPMEYERVSLPTRNPPAGVQAPAPTSSTEPIVTETPSPAGARRQKEG